MTDERGDVLERSVTVHRSAPDRAVFIEEDNADGWIASDQIVPIER
jgi:hypothetical protein